MGVHYKVVSYSDPDMFSDPEDAYLPYIWKDIDWKPVMEFLDIEFPPIYEFNDPYLSEEDVLIIRDELKMIVEQDSTFLWDDERMSEGICLRNDAAALLPYFEHYVKHNARIIRF